MISHFECIQYWFFKPTSWFFSKTINNNWLFSPVWSLPWGYKKKRTEWLKLSYNSSSSGQQQYGMLAEEHLARLRLKEGDKGQRVMEASGESGKGEIGGTVARRRVWVDIFEIWWRHLYNKFLVCEKGPKCKTWPNVHEAKPLNGWD